MIFDNQSRNTSATFLPVKQWLDGGDEQEDELEDVSKGILDAPTDNEGPGSIDEPNRSGTRLESEDEGDELIRREEAFRRNIGNLPN